MKKFKPMRKAARTFLVFLLSFLLANTTPWLPAFAADLYHDGAFQYLDANGNPLSGGKLETFDANTTTQRTVYQDAGETTPHTNPIILNSDGRVPASVFVPSGLWKYTLKSSVDTLVKTVDNIPGALDTTAFSTEFAKPREPVITITSSTTLTNTERGKVVNADATGGVFTLTLPSAVLALDGAEFTIRRTSTTGTVSITTTGGQTINGSGNTIQLLAKDEIRRLVSDGANWFTLTSAGVAPGSITEADMNPGTAGRLTPIGAVITWPGTQAGGNACPAGHLEADGAAVSRTTFADLYNLYSNSGASPGIYGDGDASTTFNLPDYRGRFLRHVDGTAALDPDKATRTDRGDGTTGNNVGTKQADAFLLHLHADGTLVWAQSTGTFSGTIAGTSLVGGIHTHSPATGGFGGTSSGTSGGSGTSTPVTAQAITLNNSASHAHTLSGTATGSTTTTGTVTGSTANTGGSETRPKNIYVLYCVFASPAGAAGVTTALNTILSGPGVPSDSLGNDGDLYYDLTNFDLYVKGTVTSGVWTLSTSVVGPAGATGATGPAGVDGTDPGIRWNFDVSTTMAEPGDGNIRLNNATLASVTLIAVDDNSGEAGNPDASAWVLSWDDIANTGARGTLVIAKASAPENFAIFNVTGGSTDNTTWVQVVVTHVASAGSFSDTDALSVHFTPAGADGSGTGDFSGPGSSADNEVVLFDGTGGKTGKRPGTSHMVPPSGTTAQRPGSPSEGHSRYNSDDNQLEFYDGTNWTQTNKPPTIQVFTASGTWTKPAGLKAAKVVAIGGGGAGGGVVASGAGQGGCGGGGGGSGTAIELFTASELGATETVTIGAGGTGGTGVGPAGGNTTFGALITGGGGGGGSNTGLVTIVTPGSGGSAGVGTSGDVNLHGAGGGVCVAFAAGAQAFGATGGASSLGGGGRGVAGTAAGSVGGNYGGGGSGAAQAASFPARNGGDGADGLVYVIEYY